MAFGSACTWFNEHGFVWRKPEPSRPSVPLGAVASVLEAKLDEGAEQWSIPEAAAGALQYHRNGQKISIYGSTNENAMPLICMQSCTGGDVIDRSHLITKEEWSQLKPRVQALHQQLLAGRLSREKKQLLQHYLTN